MATYAIGDVHGCFETLTALWERLSFDAARDRVWLVGDLVNRGPRSLDTLRWARDLGDRATVVLGNHDLHLLCRWRGFRRDKPLDTLTPVLEARDGVGLLEWLRRRPLLVEEDSRVLVHAGLLPGWSWSEARDRAREVEEILRGPRFDEILRVYSRSDLEADHPLSRAATALRAFTLLRTCTSAGRMCDFNGPPADAPPGCIPWFEVEGRGTLSREVIFGHWAALGFYQAPGLLGLDSGCVWGGALTAIRLDDGEIFREPARELSGPGCR